jgi:hypothetical protein
MPKPIENAHATYSSQIKIHKRKRIMSYISSPAPYASCLAPCTIVQFGNMAISILIE